MKIIFIMPYHLKKCKIDTEVPLSEIKIAKQGNTLKFEKDLKILSAKIHKFSDIGKTIELSQNIYQLYAKTV